MASNIDPTKPIEGSPTTQSVRDNFAAASLEVGALQDADVAFDARLTPTEAQAAANTIDIAALQGDVTSNTVDISTNTAAIGVNAGDIASLISGSIPSSRVITAGAGLTGGGDLTDDRTFDVGAGTGITVAANSVSLNTSYTDGRYAATVHTHAASDVTSGTFANARISQSSVTQHQAAINAGKVGGYNIVVDTGSPSGTDPNTIYLVL